MLPELEKADDYDYEYVPSLAEIPALLDAMSGVHPAMQGPPPLSTSRVTVIPDADPSR